MSSNNKHNERYQKNEKRILNGYLSELKRVGTNRRRISLKDIARASGLPYRTVLGHYKNFAELERSNIEEATKSICHLADECRLTGGDCRKFLKKLLFAMSKEPVRFQIEHSRMSIAVWGRVLSYSRDILTQGWISYGGEADDIIFHRFCARFISDMYLWGRADFSITDFGVHHSFLLYLVEQSAKG